MTRLLKTLLTLIAVGVAALPAVLFVSLGWYHTPVLRDPAGPGSGALLLLVLFYVLWLPGTFFALIWLFDRIGFHYAVDRRARREREQKKQRRRRRAGLELLAGQERARAQAGHERARAAAGQQQARAQARRRRARPEARAPAPAPAGPATAGPPRSPAGPATAGPPRSPAGPATAGRPGSPAPASPLAAGGERPQAPAGAVPQPMTPAAPATAVPAPPGRMSRQGGARGTDTSDDGHAADDADGPRPAPERE